MRFARTLLSAIFLLACLATLVVGALSVALVQQQVKTLPSLASLQGPIASTTTHILASDGSVIGEFSEQYNRHVALDKIPLMVQAAFISAEDRNFWKHDGIDPVAIARAMVADLRSHGRRPLGASTITQQVVKNFILGDELTLGRKVREALLAIRLEKAIGKRRVLEIYLNQTYLGQGAYGVGAASEVYFGKPVSQLDLAEAALLAAMPKGPSNYDPVRHPEAALLRRRYVLMRMVEDGKVTLDAAKAADTEPLPTPKPHLMSGTAGDYFAEEVRRSTVASMGAAALYKDGLIIKTSMNPFLQALGEKALRNGLVAYDHRHGWRGPWGHVPGGTDFSQSASWRDALNAVAPPPGLGSWKMALVLGFRDDGTADIGLPDGTTDALGLDGVRWARPILRTALGPVPSRVSSVLHPGDVILVSATPEGHLELEQIPAVEGSLVAMDVHTGRILAVVGGFSYDQGSFDRATQSERQPGSTFKPFVYLTAFEHGYDPTSPLLDSPIAIDPAPGAPVWRPGADGGDGWGLITARRALENSRNFASVRLLYDLGLTAVSKTARDFDIYPDITNYAAGLGALEVTDLRLTAAYAMIANGGFRLVPSFIDEIDNAQGVPIARRVDPVMNAADRIADPISVAQITSVLQGVVKKGTAAGALASINLPLAGKTGTTNNNVDAWFVGFSPDIAVGVHIGFDEPKPLGGTEFGGSAAAPVFGDFMKAALAAYPPSTMTFPVPKGATLMRVDPVTAEPSPTGIEEIMRDGTPPSGAPPSPPIEADSP